MRALFLHLAWFGVFIVTGLIAAEEKTDKDPKKAKEVTAPSFDGNFLGMDLQAEHLGVVLDISVSMKRSLPAVREALREKMPKTPVLHVDGCNLEKPDPRPRVAGGVAPETVTAVEMLAKYAKIDAVLWICDMGDPPNRAGVEAMAETLAEHEIRLLLLSVKNKPGPSVRKVVEGSEGEWKVVSVVSGRER